MPFYHTPSPLRGTPPTLGGSLVALICAPGGGESGNIAYLWGRKVLKQKRHETEFWSGSLGGDTERGGDGADGAGVGVPAVLPLRHTGLLD